MLVLDYLIFIVFALDGRRVIDYGGKFKQLERVGGEL